VDVKEDKPVLRSPLKMNVVQRKSIFSSEKRPFVKCFGDISKLSRFNLLKSVSK